MAGHKRSLDKSFTLKMSSDLLETMQEAANRAGMSVGDWARDRLATAVIDEGFFLPQECPENPIPERPEGSANHIIGKLIQQKLPELKAEVGAFGHLTAEVRFHRLWMWIVEINDPNLYNYAYEVFSNRRLTPLRRVHDVEARAREIMKARQAENNA